MFVPSILLDRSTLRLHGDTLLHSDMDISPHIAAHVYLVDRVLRTFKKKKRKRKQHYIFALLSFL